MNPDDLLFSSIREVGDAIRAHRTSPVELVHMVLERIDEVDGSLHSFVTVTPDLALTDASRVEREMKRGLDRGPLHGIPIGFKDVLATAGVRTTAHSRALLDWIPSEDAAVVTRLRRAGGVRIGKHALHEFAYSGPDLDTPFPPARNPWNHDHEPGGSSSGSAAAVAAGLVFGALGTDTGASVRKPAAYCGVVGLKPTYGRVSRYGAIPLSWTLDHVGPIARYVEDCAVLLQAIAGPDQRDAMTSRRRVPDYIAVLRGGVAGLRLGVPRGWLADSDGVDGDVQAAFDDAVNLIERQGARIVDIDSSDFVHARDVTIVIVAAEAYAYHEQRLQSNRDAYGIGFRTQVMEGALLSAADYIQALRARATLTSSIERLLSEVDALLSPTMATPAGPLAEVETSRRYSRPNFTSPFNLTGLPAVSVPCGFSAAGMPIGLQIGGAAFDEATILRVAFAYERATSWHDQHPVAGGRSTRRHIEEGSMQ